MRSAIPSVQLPQADHRDVCQPSENANHPGRCRTSSAAQWITITRLGWALVAAIIGSAARTEAQKSDSPQSDHVESLRDARWTGPLLAPSAATLPRGHVLAEPYVYDVRSGHSQTFGSLSYLLVGVTDELTAGFVPTFRYEREPGGGSSSAVAPGDLSVLAQVAISHFRPGHWMPATALNVEESLPTGRYDRLGDRPSDGAGSGAFTTLVGIYSQTYFWLPNRRILRARLNLRQSIPGRTTVHSVSVYGTPDGFAGRARPGPSTFLDAASEYSVTRRWVAAIDVAYEHEGRGWAKGWVTTGTSGAATSAPFTSRSPTVDALVLAPAIEFNWSSRAGVIAGVRVIESGRSAVRSTTPVMAVNMVY
jgi:hypothetical protein